MVRSGFKGDVIVGDTIYDRLADAIREGAESFEPLIATSYSA